MKRLSDLDDELLDLDEEADDDYEEDYDGYEEDEDYDDESVMASKKFLIIVAIAVLVFAVIIILMLVGKGSDKKEAESVMHTDNIAVQEQDNGSTDDAEQEIVEDDLTSGDDEEITQSAEAEGQEQNQEQDQEQDSVVSQDPQDANMSAEQGTEVNVTELLSSGSVTETNQVTIGIDVARYQGTIDWAQVAASGIDFAMVRVGYRADASRGIYADTNANIICRKPRRTVSR